MAKRQNWFYSSNSGAESTRNETYPADNPSFYERFINSLR